MMGESIRQIWVKEGSIVTCINSIEAVLVRYVFGFCIFKTFTAVRGDSYWQNCSFFETISDEDDKQPGDVIQTKLACPFCTSRYNLATEVLSLHKFKFVLQRNSTDSHLIIVFFQYFRIKRKCQCNSG